MSKIEGILICFLFFGTLIISPNKSFSQEYTPLTERQIISFLANDSIKYWDRIDTFETYHINDNINMCFNSKNNSILEYKYDSTRSVRYEYMYGGDFFLGEIPFTVNDNTILLPKIKTSYIIKFLNSDSLIMDRIINREIGKEAIYVKSKDQVQIPKPFLVGNVSR